MALQLNPVKRSSIVDALLQQLVDQMISGNLKPGDVLPSEAEIAQQWQASRNSVREAFRVLQALGIIERRQGDSSRVAESQAMPFDWLLFPILQRIGTSQELVELRLVLELGVTELVIEKARPEDFGQLEVRMRRLEALQQQETIDGDAAVDADTDFHMALTELTANRALVELSKLVMRLYAPSMKAHLTSPGGVAQATSDHRRFLEALRMRDRDEARRAVVASFVHWSRYIDLV